MKIFKITVTSSDQDLAWYSTAPFYKKFFFRMKAISKIMTVLMAQYETWECEVEQILNEHKKE